MFITWQLYKINVYYYEAHSILLASQYTAIAPGGMLNVDYFLKFIQVYYISPTIVQLQ